ncbi:protein yellow-like [Planococcus citri]|uniref:protein yellow-like n=1 Tax=Planococcus citri TaxID=170843 RepID=UPI0031F79B97
MMMANVPKFLAVCLCILTSPATTQQTPEERYRLPQTESKLVERFRWNRIDFSFGSEAERRVALENRSYIPNNTIPFGVGIWEEKLFITIPRRNPGVPATLNYININSSENAPLLTPYPDWASNHPSEGNIVSIYRVNIDSCDRLWAMDAGSVTDFEGNGQRIQSPRLLIINLKTDQIIKSHQLDSSPCNAIYINIFPDIRDSCEDAYAYAVDPTSNGLLVYSLQKDASWRKFHPYFSPDPFQMEFRVNGLSFSWTDGIFGLGLTERSKQGDKWLYFHPMCSLNEFTMNTRFLRDPNATLTSNQISIAATRNATFQAASQAYDDKSGILFYSLVNKNAIGCWNTRKQGSFAANSDIVVSNDRTMVYFVNVKIDNNNLWAMSNRVPEVIYGSGLYSDQPNFRVFSGSLRQAIRNTNCDVNRSFWSRKV